MEDPIMTEDDQGPQPDDAPVAEAFTPSADRSLADEEPSAETEGWDPGDAYDTQATIAEAASPADEPQATIDEAASPADEPQVTAQETAEDEAPAVAEAEPPAQPTQEALFAAEPDVPAPAEGDDTVTSFGGPPDDLDAIRAELSGPEEPEQPAEETEAAALGGGVAAAAEAAEEEAAEALAEAGVPEGDDDEPEAVEALLDAESAEGLLEPERVDRGLSTPFLIYLGVWLVFAVAMVLVLRNAAIAGTLDRSFEYPVFVLVGLVLTVVGPLLAIVAWLLVRSRTDADSRRGLLAVALLRGSLATFGGVVLWWAARVLLDYFRTGRLF